MTGKYREDRSYTGNDRIIFCFVSLLFASVCAFIVSLFAAVPVYAGEAVWTLNAEEGQDAGIITQEDTDLAVPATIIVMRRSNLVGVYDAAGRPIKTFIASTGKEGHKTPLGTYTIYQHTDNGGMHLMVDGTYGRYCMRFRQGGYMFHSVCYTSPAALLPIPEEVAALGTSVSRGCVRLSVEDAAWLYAMTPDGCVVIVTDD